jgi:hypothetical protein
MAPCAKSKHFTICGDQKFQVSSTSEIRHRFNDSGGGAEREKEREREREQKPKQKPPTMGFEHATS